MEAVTRAVVTPAAVMEAVATAAVVVRTEPNILFIFEKSTISKYFSKTFNRLLIILIYAIFFKSQAMEKEVVMVVTAMAVAATVLLILKLKTMQL